MRCANSLTPIPKAIPVAQPIAKSRLSSSRDTSKRTKAVVIATKINFNLNIAGSAALKSRYKQVDTIKIKYASMHRQ
jgi:hypothetical protein